MIRVLICDDQTVVRDGLEAILSTDDEIEVVGVARHGQEALDLAADRQPDVVLMDLKMPVLNGVQATERLRKSWPGIRVLVLTTYADDTWVLDANDSVTAQSCYSIRWDGVEIKPEMIMLGVPNFESPVSPSKSYRSKKKPVKKK